MQAFRERAIRSRAKQFWQRVARPREGRERTDQGLRSGTCYRTLQDSSGRLFRLRSYLRSWEYEPDAEYVDGEIEERPRGEFDHNA